MVKRPAPSRQHAVPAATVPSGGILPVQAIRALTEQGAITARLPFTAKQLQPASLDLRLGATAWRVRASFLPGRGGTIAEKLDDLALHRFELSNGAVLETGCVYIVALAETLRLPPDLAASANPKSSTGRLDVFTRVIAEGVQAFDQVPGGYAGPLYAEICPQTFPVVVREGSTLAQLRFRRGDPRESDDVLRAMNAAEPLVAGGIDDIADGVALSVDMSPDGGLGPGNTVGWRARRNTGVVDIDKPGSRAVEDYWEPLTITGGRRRVILDPDQFYILASKEAVCIPPTHAAEMLPFNPLVGEFRVHYAGFMDPGFGWAPAGGGGARVVLEVRSHKVPFILEDGQIIGRLIYERMTERPDTLYGRDLGSHYQAQRLKLSKHFV